MRDFKDEVDGYLNNNRIVEALDKLPLQKGLDKLNDNLRICYEELVRMELVAEQELDLVEAWIADLKEISGV